MEMIQIDYDGRVAVVKLAHSVTNAINMQVVTELTECLQNVNTDPHANSVVLSSLNEKFFSIGLDIPTLYGLSKKDFAAFYQAFTRVLVDLYTLPKPTIAAITGHAVAGGCILAICCDYRFIGEGKKLMGLNELNLGVPVPYPADCILPHIVGPRTARDIIESSQFYLPEQLYQMGLVDVIVPLEEVLPKAIEKARELGQLPHKAFSIVKQNRTEMVKAQILSRLEEKEQLFVECWVSDEARKRLSEAAKKF
jgi:enoyl-CoA hydratase/carnithine racemase